MKLNEVKEFVKELRGLSQEELAKRVSTLRSHGRQRAYKLHREVICNGVQKSCIFNQKRTLALPT